MALSIWKFVLGMQGSNVLQMPEGARILCLREQGEMPCIWALVDPDAPQQSRAFATYGTGHPIDGDPGEYVGTTIHLGGSLVLHTFECGR